MRKIQRVLIAFSIVALGFTGSASATTFSGYGAPSSNAYLAGGTVIDFESETLGAFTSLTIGGVTFSTTANEVGYINNDYAGNYNTTGKSLVNTYAANGFFNLFIDFSSPVNAFGFNWGAADQPWVLTAYDSSSNFLDSYVLPATYGSNAGDYFGIAAAGIKSATLQTEVPGDYVFVDNFTYSGRQVPEPSALLLLGSGLLGLALFRRMRKEA